MSCDYQSIVNASKCYECIPPNAQMGVHTYLLKSISGYTGDVNSLMNAARCIASCIPPGMLNEVKTRLLCEVVDNLVPPAPPTPECSNPLVDAVGTGWMDRVVANGGAEPSESTRLAVCAFCDGLDDAGLTAKMIAVTCFVPDNLIAAITPVIRTAGNDPWTNNGPFLAADLTLDGLIGNGASKYLNTGVVPSVSLSLTSAGLSLYNTTASIVGSFEISARTAGATVLNFLVSGFPNLAFFDCWDAVGGRLTAVNSLWTGFLSGNRIAANNSAIYRANSGVPFATLASNATAGGTRPAIPLYCFARNDSGVANSFSPKRLSFAAIHQGLTAAECEDLFDLVQQLRVRLGGGFV